jgi:2-oxoisovalerate dehydrogenase E1 component
MGDGYAWIPHGGGSAVAARTAVLSVHDGAGRKGPELKVARFPEKLSPDDLYRAAYLFMYLSRRLEERIFELYQKGYVKGTVTVSAGNEATAAGMAMPFRPGKDVVSFLHRDLAAHLLFGATPRQLLCQYLANAESPTRGREGNCHHGDAAHRRFPMISHLGQMLPTVVGGVWAARAHGEEVFGLAVIGDGGTSTGDFHEALNLASVLEVPVLFLVENNHYAFSTPTCHQYRCQQLSDRAHGYGIEGRTVDGLDAWAVYEAVYDAMAAMREDRLPRLIECMTLRLFGHAVYDKGTYVPAEKLEAWRRQDPVPATRQKLLDKVGMSEAEVAGLEAEADREVLEAVAKAVPSPRPGPSCAGWRVFGQCGPRSAKRFQASKVKNGDAVNRALEYLLENNPRAFLVGLDVGPYGSAFKTCKGLFERYGRARVIDMPLGESGIVGFCLGASQVGGEPILEFQFADFSTEAVTQLGLNAGTWYFRAGREAPMLVRMPCGGGLTMGAFHSGEFEGLWSRFPGLKLLYPATPQETFEALVAGFYDRNPCLVFEHKLLYWTKSGDIDFDGDLTAVWRPRCHREGNDVTVVAFGAMVHEALAAAALSPRSVEVWNPFVLQPLDLRGISASVQKTGRLLVVQECGELQGLGDAIISRIVRERLRDLVAPPRLVAAPDAPVPFAPELETSFRPAKARILAAIDEMFGGDGS